METLPQPVAHSETTLCVACSAPAEPGRVACRACAEYAIASVCPPLDDLSAPEHQEMDALEDSVLRHLAPVDMPVVHLWTPGLYTRVIFMAAGTLLTSKVHRTRHVYHVLSGQADVYIPGKGWERITAPRVSATEPFTRRALFIVKDCLWSTSHPLTAEEDAEPDEAKRLAMIEARIIEPHRPEVHQQYRQMINDAVAALEKGAVRELVEEAA